jgi:hypothetical protein
MSRLSDRGHTEGEIAAWLDHPVTKSFARLLETEESRRVKELVAVAKKSTDPRVCAAASRAGAVRDALDRMRGMDDNEEEGRA